MRFAARVNADLVRIVLLLLAFCALPFAAPALAAPPTAPRNFAATAFGHLVELTWDGGVPQGAVVRVEAGSAPALTDIASFTLPQEYFNRYQIFGVPSGTYYVRLRIVAGSEVSAPSNEVALTVIGCPAPLVPPVLEARVFGQNVQLQWTFGINPVGCGATRLRIEAGQAPGAANLLNLDVPDFNVTIRSFNAVPAGIDYVRVRVGRDGTDDVLSNELQLNIACVPPPTLVNPQATVVGNGVRFSWGYPFQALGAFAVVIEAGSSPGASDVGSITAPRDANTGFNVTGAGGTYYARLRAVNACGSTVSEELPVTLENTCLAPGAIPLVNAVFGGSGSPLNVMWEAPVSGGLATSYRVEIGSSRGESDVASRVVEGRWGPSYGFSESFSGINVSWPYLRVTPLNSCGAGPRSIEAHTTCGTPAPLGGSVNVVGRRVHLGWIGGSEYDPIMSFVVEIGSALYGSDVLTTPVLSSTYPGFPGYSVELPPGRYYARARRVVGNCPEHSNASRELSFVIP